MSKRPRSENKDAVVAEEDKQHVFWFGLWSPVHKTFWHSGQLFAFRFTQTDKGDYAAKDLLTGHTYRADKIDGEFVVEETKEMALVKTWGGNVYHLRSLAAHNCARDLLYMQGLTGAPSEDLPLWVGVAQNWSAQAVTSAVDKESLEKELAAWRKLILEVNESFDELVEEYCGE